MSLPQFLFLFKAEVCYNGGETFYTILDFEECLMSRCYERQVELPIARHR